MSPEQARGLTVDKRTDIWAFGCVVFEMLAGRGPFGAATVCRYLRGDSPAGAGLERAAARNARPRRAVAAAMSRQRSKTPPSRHRRRPSRTGCVPCAGGRGTRGSGAKSRCARKAVGLGLRPCGGSDCGCGWECLASPFRAGIVRSARDQTRYHDAADNRSGRPGGFARRPYGRVLCDHAGCVRVMAAGSVGCRVQTAGRDQRRPVSVLVSRWTIAWIFCRRETEAHRCRWRGRADAG